MTKEKMFIEYYSKLNLKSDPRVIFNVAEKDRIRSIKEEMKKNHNKAYIICEEIWAEYDLPDHEYLEVFAIETKSVAKKLEKLEKEFIRIQLNAEQKFMSNTFGNDVQAVINDAKGVIEDFLKKNNPLDSRDAVFGETQKIRVQGIYNSVLYPVRMHSNYLKNMGTIDGLIDFVSEKVKEYFKDTSEYSELYLQIENEIKKSNPNLEKENLKTVVGTEMILQSTPLATLAMLSSKKNDLAVLKRDGLYVYMDDREKKGVEINCLVLQFIDMLIIEYNNNGRKSNEISFPVSKYMERRGVKAILKARNQIKKVSLTISHLMLEYRGKLDNKKFSFEPLTILQKDIEIRKGIVKIQLSASFCEVIKKLKVMPYPTKLFSFDETKNPHSYYLLRRIIWHKNINFKHLNADIVSVDTLIHACPNLSKYEMIVGSGQINQRIIKPFEQGMNSLMDILSWEYFLKDKPFSKDAVEYLGYNMFAKLMVHVTWVNYPVLNKNNDTSE